MGRAAQPSPDLIPNGEGTPTPPPHTHRRLDYRAFGADLWPLLTEILAIIRP